MGVKLFHAGVLAARFGGLAPYTCRRASAAHSAVWNPSRAWRAYSLALSVTMASVEIRYLVLLFNKSENVSGVTRNMSITAQAVNVMVGFFCRSFRLHLRLWRILNSKLTRRGLNNASALPAVALLVARVGGYLIVFISYINLNSSFIGYFSSINLLASHIIESVETFLFVYLIGCASEVFRELHGDVLELAASSSSSTADDVIRLRERYQRAVDFTESLRACFGPQKLLVCVKDCWELTASSFILMTAMLRSELLPFHHCVGLAAFLLAYLLFLLSAERVAYQAKSVLPAVHFILCKTRTLSDRERKELMIFSGQIKQNPAYISLGGAVTLNAKLFFEICAGIASYLIILLQFQSSESLCEDRLVLLKNITNTSLTGIMDQAT